MGRIEDLSIVKKTLDIRRNKNPFYKRDFLPKNWRAPFKADIKWRPKPNYLMKWKTGVSAVQQFTTRGAQARMPGRRRHKTKYSKK